VIAQSNYGKFEPPACLPPFLPLAAAAAGRALIRRANPAFQMRKSPPSALDIYYHCATTPVTIARKMSAQSDTIGGIALTASALVSGIVILFFMSLLIAVIVVYGFSHTINENLIHPAIPRPFILLHSRGGLLHVAGLLHFSVRADPHASRSAPSPDRLVRRRARRHHARARYFHRHRHGAIRYFSLLYTNAAGFLIIPSLTSSALPFRSRWQSIGEKGPSSIAA